MKRMIRCCVLLLGLFALSGCKEEEPFDPSVCFNIAFHRYKLGQFIIDLPPHTDAWAAPETEVGRRQRFAEAFVSLLGYKGDSPDGLVYCQRKDHVPYDAFDKLNVMYKQGHLPLEQRLRVRELETFAFALPSGLYPKQRGNVFKISEIPQIRVVSATDRPQNNHDTLVSDLVFAVDDREQQLFCNIVRCDALAVQDEDGLIYLIPLLRYIRKSPVGTLATTDERSFNILTPQATLETIHPVLNFALGLRNRDAEKGLK